MKIPSRTYIDSRWNLHGYNREFAWPQAAICMDARGEFEWKKLYDN